MKAFLMGSALSLLVLASGPANAQYREDYVRHLHWKCEQGDDHACHLVRLHRACEEGDRGACERQHLLRACDEGDLLACERVRLQSWH